MGLLDSTKKYPMRMPDGTEIKQVVHLKEVIGGKDIAALEQLCAII